MDADRWWLYLITGSLSGCVVGQAISILCINRKQVIVRQAKVVLPDQSPLSGRAGEVLTLQSHDTRLDILVDILVMVMELMVVRSSVVGMERGGSVQV